jgi:nicotinamidase/pyrazinamidase
MRVIPERVIMIRMAPAASTPIFWDVDTQRDFIEPGGKLYVAGAETIVPNLKRLTDWAAAHRALVIASMCAHHDGDPEFAQYGPHCLEGTPGQQKVPQTVLPDHLIVPNRSVELPQGLQSFRQIVIEKDKLDVFSNPNVAALLDRLGREREVVLYGVVTEICVAFTARGLIARGFRVNCVTDAIRALNEANARQFLEEIVRAGAQLTTTADLLQKLDIVHSC